MTTIFPVFTPWKSPINASGAESRPDATVSTTRTARLYQHRHLLLEPGTQIVVIVDDETAHRQPLAHDADEGQADQRLNDAIEWFREHVQLSPH